MKRASLLILSLLFVIFLASCKKDNNNNGNEECTLSQASIAGTYTITSATSQKNGGAIDTIPLEGCEADDEFVLNADSTASIVDAGIKCDPSSDETGGSWAYADNKLYLAIKSDDVEDRDTLDVVSFDCKTLTVSTSYEEAGTTIKEVTVFTRK